MIFIHQLIMVLLLTSCTDFIAQVDLQKEWQVLGSGNIVLHYRSPDFGGGSSPEDEEARFIAANQNYYYQAIQDSIQKDFTGKVLIYLYNQDEALEHIGTSGGGHALPKVNTFYYAFIPGQNERRDKYGIENPFVGAHEMVHVITHRALGYPGTKLMSEGYAVWLDGSYGGHSIRDDHTSLPR
ncbi:MAG: hypothetical protein U5N56_12130 [Candidatus Marinimicrobia bacterium]|nr:hypothetical protein [Candidatus Neomarinimicrobiota bacterium]